MASQSSLHLMPPKRILSTVQQFSARYPAFTPGSLRSLIFMADANGLRPSLVRIGRKLLIDEEKFFCWIDQMQHLSEMDR